MSGVLAALAGSTVSSVITVSSNWGSFSGASLAFSPVRTLTISGPGNVKFSFSGSVSWSYLKNGGGGIAIANNDVVAFANGDTLQFLAGTPTGTSTMTVTNATNSAAIGTAVATVT